MKADIRDIQYMRLALREAKKGIGRTSPNPCVGAVIVKDGEVIARGYHKKAGTPHAEIHALQAAGDRSLGATMYVTLEPCNHTGKTPPCSHAVARAGIKRVVVGMEDPNPLVDGTGISYLRERNVEVVSGVLESECREINLPFLKHIATGLPWMVMKAGISLDGRLNYQQGKSGWITGPESGRKVHRLRDTYDAILVGSGTALIDDPSLTTRLAGNRGRDPVRIIIDRTLKLSPQAKPYSVESKAPAWVICAGDADRRRIERLTESGVKVLPVGCRDGRIDLGEAARAIGRNGITSVLVEGGGAIHGALLKDRLYDYAHLFVAPIFAGDAGTPLLYGYSATDRDDAVSLTGVKYHRMGQDMMVSGEIRYPAKRV